MKISPQKLLFVSGLIFLCLTHFTIKFEPSVNAQQNINDSGKIRQSVANGLEFIAKNQKPDGSWPTEYSLSGKVVIASICGLALMTSGSTPETGLYANHIKKTVSFVTQNIEEPGLTARATPALNQINWSLSIGGLFLLEAYRLNKSPDLKQKLESICRTILENQEPSGGWAHGPHIINTLNYLELNVVTNWNLTAIGIAEQLKIIKRDHNKINKAIAYLMDSSSADGGVGYSTRAGQKGYGCPGRTGGTIMAFFMLNKKNHPFYPKMSSFLAKEMPFLLNKRGYGHASPTMGLFCLAAGARHSSESNWKQFTDFYFPKILESQQMDGSFHAILNPTETIGQKDNAIYGTFYISGFLTLILQLGGNNLLIDRGTDCDLEKLEKIPFCPNCRKRLAGYQCPQCNKMFPLEEGTDKNGTTVESRPKRECPDCGNDKLTETQLVIDNQCFFCQRPVTWKEICIKNISSCSEHSLNRSTKVKNCPLCKKKFELAEISSSEISISYECAACGIVQENEGKCPGCKKNMVKKKRCERSGTFPHINEK
ncbi:MAG: DUF6288 domain-containing protein [Planctomycetota bacterium]